MNKCVYCGSEGLEDVVIYVDYACKGGAGGGGRGVGQQWFMVCVPFETQDAHNWHHSEVFFFLLLVKC